VLSQNFYLSSNLVLWSGLGEYHNIPFISIQLSEWYGDKQTAAHMTCRFRLPTLYYGNSGGRIIESCSQGQAALTRDQYARAQKLLPPELWARSSELD